MLVLSHYSLLSGLYVAEPIMNKGLQLVDKLKLFWGYPGVSEIAAAVIAAFVTHLFGIYRLKVQQGIKFKNTLGEKIADAIINVRETELVAGSVEAYRLDVEQPISKLGVLNDNPIYPSFMKDKSTYSEYITRISNARKTYEPYLSLKSAAYLLIMERYLLDLSISIHQINAASYLKEVGLLVAVDIQKWQKAFDNQLVRELNHPHYKLYSRRGKKWNKVYESLNNDFRNKSMLNEMISNMDKYEEYIKGVSLSGN